jgi:hypothetical protein
MRQVVYDIGIWELTPAAAGPVQATGGCIERVRYSIGGDQGYMIGIASTCFGKAAGIDTHWEPTIVFYRIMLYIV